MTVSTEISSNEYTGNGVTTDFDYKFRIFKANQLSVITSDADGDNVVTLRLGTDYTVTNANKSAGGKVILTKPLASGHKISIARDIPIKQETSFRNQSKFFAETHEDAFDYLTMILQRIWGSLGSLYLKRPNILANWFDAKGYRIANLGKPKRDSDAVDLGTLNDEVEGVSSTILKREKRLLRVDDMDITSLPKASERAGNVLTFDKDGKPIVVAPATGSAVDVLNQLANGDGSLIGVGVGTLKDIVNWVTLEQFGADPTGINNSLTQIQDAFNFANEYGFSVIQSRGVFNISGDGDIIINTNTDFNGAIFRPESWNGSFSIKRKNNWETHDASSLIVKKIKESGVIGKGGNFLPSLVNEDLLNDSFIIINSNQPMYYYRNNIRYRKELNQVLYGGQLLCPMYYSLDTNTITSVLSLKLEKTFIDVSGLSIDESRQNTGVAFVKIANSSKINLNKISFHSRGEYKSNPSERISVSRCAYVFIDGVLCSDVSIASPAGSTYTIYMGESLDININKMTSEGYGWGAVGANEVRRSSFNNSSLSRIDFHNPSMEYLKISNTNIGNWGLLLSCMGDVYLDNVKFIQRDAYNNSGFIRGRDDAGGFCDGNLYAKNVTVEGFYYPNAANRGFISSSSTNNVKELPAGSPLSLSMFNEVNITNLNLADSYKDKDFRLWSAFSNPSLTPPKVFNLTGASTDSRLSLLAMEVTTESKIAVNLKQCIFSELYIRATASVQVESVIDSARSNVGDGVSLALQARGNYNVTNSSIAKLEGFMSDWNLNRNVSISECDVYATKSSDIMRLTNTGSVDWHRNKMHFTENTIAEFGNNLNKYIGYSKFYDNSVFVDGVEVIGIPVPNTFNLVRNKITRFKLHMVRASSSTTEDIIFNNESSSFGQYVNVSMSPAQPSVTIDDSVTKRYLV